MNPTADRTSQENADVDRKAAPSSFRHPVVAVLGAAQVVLVVAAAGLEVGAHDGRPPGLAAAVAFALLFLAPGVLALLRSGPIAFADDTPQQRRIWLLLGLFFFSTVATLTIYRMGLAVSDDMGGLWLATWFFFLSLEVSLSAVIAFCIVKENAEGLEIPVDVVDVFVFAAATIGLMEVLGGANLDFSAEALGTRGWMLVGGILLGFYVVCRVHGYRELPFAKHTLAVVVTLVLVYSAYSALTFRIPALPYWPDPVLRALASGSAFLLPLTGGRRVDPPLRPQRRYQTYPILLGFLGAVLVALVLDVLIKRGGGVAATPQSVIVVMTGLILLRQYLSYLQGKKIFEEARTASELYTNLVEEAPDPIVELDPEGRITLVNSAFCGEFVIPKETAIGRRLADLVEQSPFDFDIAPETKKPVAESRRSSRPSRSSVAEPAGVIKVRFRSPHGEKIIEAAGRQDKQSRLQLILRDVTERVVLDEQIADLSERLTGKDRSRSELLMKLIGAFEDERRRIARKLVEGPAQAVDAAANTLAHPSSASVGGSEQEKIEYALRESREQLGRAVQNLRKAIEELRPTILEEKGLEAAIRALANQLSRGPVSAVDVRWQAHPQLSHGQENLLYSALRDIFSAVKADAGVRSAVVDVTDFQSRGIRIDLTFVGEPAEAATGETAPAHQAPGEPNKPDDVAGSFVSPAEKIEAIGGSLTPDRSPEGAPTISIKVESVLSSPAVQPAREPA